MDLVSLNKVSWSIWPCRLIHTLLITLLHVVEYIFSFFLLLCGGLWGRGSYFCVKFWLLCSYTLKIILICSDEGKVRKILKLEPLPDGSGHFFNLSNTLSSYYYIFILFYILAIFMFVGHYEMFLGSLRPWYIVRTTSSSPQWCIIPKLINLNVIILKHKLPDSLFINACYINEES